MVALPKPATCAIVVCSCVRLCAAVDVARRCLGGVMQLYALGRRRFQPLAETPQCAYDCIDPADTCILPHCASQAVVSCIPPS
eukprot:15442230-Alexandrium_andersonii.AAC.1